MPDLALNEDFQAVARESNRLGLGGHSINGWVCKSEGLPEGVRPGYAAKCALCGGEVVVCSGSAAGLPGRCPKAHGEEPKLPTLREALSDRHLQEALRTLGRLCGVDGPIPVAGKLGLELFGALQTAYWRMPR